MKDIITDRLNRINNLNDRKLLKSVLLDAYENIVNYNMEMYEKLEERLYGEIDNHMDSFAIYTALDYWDNVDPTSDFLHPMLSEDDNSDIDLKEVSEKIINKEEVVIATVFMKCDNIIISELFDKNRIFKGILSTNQNTYEISAKVKRCGKYVNEIEKLYRIFQQNNIAWNTVNCPYAYKFIDIILNPDIPLVSGELISEVTINLGEYEKYKLLNVTPLWNVKIIEAEDKSFPMPAKDRINYEHAVSVMDFGNQNGYLVGLDNEEFLYTKRLNEELIIVSGNDSQHSWNLLQIENISNLRRNKTAFEMLSNKRDLGFAGKYSTLKSIVIRTKGELARLLRSYEQSKTVIFQTVEILESYDKNKNTQTIDYNSFIDDNIRVDLYKKIMLLKFKVTAGEDFLAYDKTSFFVSEMQVLFPEYKCVGELV